MNTGLIVSTDMGKTWAQYDLKEFGKRSPTRFHEKNGEGWFRVDLRSEWIQQAQREPSLCSGFALMLAQLGFKDRLFEIVLSITTPQSD